MSSYTGTRRRILLVVGIILLTLICFSMFSCKSGQDTPKETTPGDKATDEQDTKSDSVCKHEYDNACDKDCNICGETRVTKHTEQRKDGKDATCTDDGYTDSAVCSICGYVIKEQQTIKALGHSEKIIPGAAPTCTDDGYTDETVCGVCGYVIKEKQVIEAKGHSEKKLPGHAATCTEDGLTDGAVCDICGYTITEQQTIKALGHSEEIIPGVAATDTEDGLTDGIICNVCGYVIKEQQVIKALGTYLQLTDDKGRTDFCIIISSYAAKWEKSAAQELSNLLGCDIVTDDGAEPAQHEIIVGYTNRRQALDMDFDAIGHEGYMLYVTSDKIFFGANCESGMSDAMEKLKSLIVKKNKRMSVKYDTSIIEPKQGEKPEEKLPGGEYSDSISWAQQVMNKVQMGYGDGKRNTYLMSNMHLGIEYNLSVAKQKRVTALTNPDGIPYIQNTMDAYIIGRDGTNFLAANSAPAGRANIYEFGYYYYNAHILDQVFGEDLAIDEASGIQPVDMLAMTNDFGGHDANRFIKNDMGVLSFIIQNTEDPYVVFGNTFYINTAEYNAIEITMKSPKSSTAEIFFVAGDKKNFSNEQRKVFAVIPDEQYHTYYVRLDDIESYTGLLSKFRLDVGAEAGEKIEISGVRAVRVKDVDLPRVALDRTYHIYSDKLNSVTRFVASESVSNLGSVGLMTKIDASRVLALVVKDANGIHTDLEGVDWDTAEYVGFDIDRAGIFGYILIDGTHVGKMTVMLEDGCYVIDQRYVLPEGVSMVQYSDIKMGQRIYTDMTHSFDTFLKEAELERHPLTELKITEQADKAAVAGYDALRGAYRFNVTGTGFNEPYYDIPNKYFSVNAGITGDDSDRKIYVYTHTDFGNLENGVVLDGNKELLPIAVEVCKNFKGENEEPLYDYGDWGYGEIFLPLTVKANKEVEFTVLNLYQNWGKYPLKQLSSIQFIAPYYHLSCGVTETNCIAPYYVFGKDLWTLPDFRSMSAPLWDSQPQHTSIGRLYFLEYLSRASSNLIGTEQVWDKVDSSGPIYADISMKYLSDDGKIDVQYRHVELPHTDENRTYYTIELTVNEDVSIYDFKRDFSFFTFDGRDILFDKLGYLDENNQFQVVDSYRNASPRYIKLGNDHPYFDFYSCPSSGDYVNFALLVKDWDITVGGEEYTGNLMLREKYINNLNVASLTLDLDKVSLKAGDKMVINMILLPWGSQLTENDEQVRSVRQDSCIEPYSIQAVTGTVIPDTYIPKIMSDNGNAEFTLSGGANNAVVRVYGLTDYKKPVIQELVDGTWVNYDTSVCEYDGYMVYYDGDGTYSIALVIPMSGQSRTFRVMPQNNG